MKNITYTNLKKEIKVLDEYKTLLYKGLEIEIKQYLSIAEKTQIVENILNNLKNDYCNWIDVELYFHIEIIKAYTNITFTQKQEEQLDKIYDNFKVSGLFKDILDNIPEKEIKDIQLFLKLMIEEIYKYKNSARGIMEDVSNNYSNVELDVNKLVSSLQGAENLDLVRDVVQKLG